MDKEQIKAAFEAEMRKDLGIPDCLELNWKAEYVATAWKYYQVAFDLAQAQNDQDLRALAHERARADRLQRILDTRPAFNAGLPQTYIEWSQSIYIMDAAHARETPQ